MHYGINKKIIKSAHAKLIIYISLLGSETPTIHSCDNPPAPHDNCELDEGFENQKNLRTRKNKIDRDTLVENADTCLLYDNFNVEKENADSIPILSKSNQVRSQDQRPITQGSLQNIKKDKRVDIEIENSVVEIEQNDSSLAEEAYLIDDNEESNLSNSVETYPQAKQPICEKSSSDIESKRETRNQTRTKNVKVIVSKSKVPSTDEAKSKKDDKDKNSSHNEQEKNLFDIEPTRKEKRGRKRKTFFDETNIEDNENKDIDKSSSQSEKNDLLHSSESDKIHYHEVEKEVPSVEEIKGRRGRKRKIATIENNQDESKSDDNKLKRTPVKSSKVSSFQCGKCPNSTENYPSLMKFKDHVIREHGGLARPIGESQEFSSEEEIHALLKEAFVYKKQVSCYQCKQKKFTSFGGLKMHLLTCGKTKDECDVSSNYFNFWEIINLNVSKTILMVII